MRTGGIAARASEAPNPRDLGRSRIRDGVPHLVHSGVATAMMTRRRTGRHDVRWLHCGLALIVTLGECLWAQALDKITEAISPLVDVVKD